MSNANIRDMNVLAAISIAKYSLYSSFNNSTPYPPQAKKKSNGGHILADVIGGVIRDAVGGPLGALEGGTAGTAIYDYCS